MRYGVFNPFVPSTMGVPLFIPVHPSDPIAIKSNPKRKTRERKEAVVARDREEC